MMMVVMAMEVEGEEVRFKDKSFGNHAVEEELEEGRVSFSELVAQAAVC